MRRVSGCGDVNQLYSTAGRTAVQGGEDLVRVSIFFNERDETTLPMARSGESRSP